MIFSEEELREFLQLAEHHFRFQRKLLDLPSDRTLVVGDIHGDLQTMKKAFKLLDDGKVERVIFNGDIVDRGPQMIECAAMVIARALIEPTRVYFLRGNHELSAINSVYGFRGYTTAYWNTGYDHFSRVFYQLPLTAKLDDGTFITHGGIPTQTFYFHLMRLELKTREPENASRDWQLLWNDPDERLRKFGPSIRGEGVYRFGREAFHDFMELHDLEFFIRSHSAVRRGYKWNFSKKLLTVFSSKAGPYKRITPHFVKLGDGVELISSRELNY